MCQNDKNDLVVIGLHMPKGSKTLDVSKVFNDGDKLFDAYSNNEVVVKDGKVVIDSEYQYVLLERK